MPWESTLLEVFDDLEQQAEGLHLAERDAEVSDLSLSEYARVGLASRCHAGVGRELSVRLLGGARVGGRLVRAGAEWLVLHDSHTAWLVPLDAVAAVAGLGQGADHESTWSVADTLPLRALLRRVAQESAECQLHLRDGHRLDGAVTRVGADFLQLRAGMEPGERTAEQQGQQGQQGQLVPLGVIAGVRWRSW